MTRPVFFGVAAIIGFPYIAGFFSKDAILYLAFAKNNAQDAYLILSEQLGLFNKLRLADARGTPPRTALPYSGENRGGSSVLCTA
mgnify:CR=1 FL=1